ncbi:hypothetical protein [Burkholderia sp. Nafp2/4-1b]|uniref:hypothetical protein n=1 Tax=Burkholderia sp. Nafp2/4-1b TaxID=2116686 RepID=UPI001969BC3E|nr:hypothetical protein [Burkholderia sp. Nafp2/4-1b]
MLLKRRSMRIWWCIFAAVALCAAIYASTAARNGKDKTMSPQVVTIKFGADGKSDAVAQGFSTMNHPSGVYAYQMHWDDPKQLGRVKYSQGQHSFDLDNVTIATGLGDKDSPESGVDNWDVNFNISPSGTTSYEDARDKIAALLAKLRAAGWKRYIETSDPRLVGKEATVYALAKPGGLYSIDSTYTPTVEEWKKLIASEPRWLFYTDGVFLTLSLSYQSSTHDTGYYLTDIQISTASDNYTPYFADSVERRRQWKKYLSDELTPARAERAKHEAELTALGYTIDTTYLPPPFEAPDFSAKAGDTQ